MYRTLENKVELMASHFAQGVRPYKLDTDSMQFVPIDCPTVSPNFSIEVYWLKGAEKNFLEERLKEVNTVILMHKKSIGLLKELVVSEFAFKVPVKP